MDKKIVIFGAGETGVRALKKYGFDKVAFWIDNNKEKHGKQLKGITIYSVEAALPELEKYHIVIASQAQTTMEEQLQELGLTDYEIYQTSGYYDMPEVVFNPYDDFLAPDIGNLKEDTGWRRDEINRRVAQFKGGELFDHVEIETLNRCNGICSFCPVNHNVDKREFKKMDKHLFKKIIDELAEINYSGQIALFSNNEPFLDENIIEYHAYMKEKLPNAWRYLCTNGTLLTMDLFEQVIEYLDELVIDNYNQELKLIPNAQKILEFCEAHPEYKKKVTIILRNPNEVLTNRGGDAPNRVGDLDDEKEGNTSCLLPFRQLIIRPDGKVSLCCNDALGNCTMGDVSKESILEVWNGKAFREIREKIRPGRKNLPKCRFCDVALLG